ncbi:MAG: leucine-rich repeat domain-containing protein [Oscillospiraceae bacterium]|jgi:hypothetical protein|nr:leucine-rich repeat domain-containing protein [Oscillospiraceae bacterium]
MALIIAAHAGTGKTYAAKMNSNLFTDLTYYTYRYDIPEDFIHNKEDSEAIKAEFRFPRNFDYPENYIEAIKNASKENKIILIVPDPYLLSTLEEENIPYVIAYPERSAKEEYRQRFIKRGNEDNFMRIFTGSWDGFIDDFVRNTYARHIVLESHEYLTDVLDKSMLNKSIEEVGEKNTWKVFTEDDADLLKDEHIIIPTGYDEIGKYAFVNREDIRSVVIPEGVSYIADSAFAYCTMLKNIFLPDSIERVDETAFFNCDGLIGDGVTFKEKTYEYAIDVHNVTSEFYEAINGGEEK